MSRRTTNPPGFQAFWDAYALKRDRMAAERAWNKLSAKDRRAAMSGVASYRADCLQRGVAMMYAQGYLNHRRWEDDLSGQSSASPALEAPQSSPTLHPEMDTW